MAATDHEKWKVLIERQPSYPYPNPTPTPTHTTTTTIISTPT